MRIDPASLDQLLHPTLDPKAKREVIATGEQLEKASATLDQNQRPAVSVNLNDAAGRAMRSVTRENLGKPMAIPRGALRGAATATLCPCDSGPACRW